MGDTPKANALAAARNDIRAVAVSAANQDRAALAA
jgi:hypothetical protein